MKTNYKLTNSDFLEYQLYTSSKSKSHKKKRFRSRYTVFILYILIGLYFAYKNDNIAIGGIIASFGLLWFAFYPMYAKWNYKRHFKKHVEENYKNRIDKPVDIEFDENSLHIKDFTSQSKINGTELKTLIETKNHFFIKLTTDLSLIVPKHSIENLIKFKKSVTDLGAEYIDELHWEWK